MTDGLNVWNICSGVCIGIIISDNSHRTQNAEHGPICRFLLDRRTCRLSHDMVNYVVVFSAHILVNAICAKQIELNRFALLTHNLIHTAARYIQISIGIDIHYWWWCTKRRWGRVNLGSCPCLWKNSESNNASTWQNINTNGLAFQYHWIHGWSTYVQNYRIFLKHKPYHFEPPISSSSWPQPSHRCNSYATWHQKPGDVSSLEATSEQAEYLVWSTPSISFNLQRTSIHLPPTTSCTVLCPFKLQIDLLATNTFVAHDRCLIHYRSYMVPS